MSRYILIIVDALIFSLTTLLLAQKFGVPERYIILTTVLFTFFGIYVLFMKGFYKVSKYEFRLKDAYLLLEGIVLAAIIPCIILLIIDFSWQAYKFLLKDVFVVYFLMFIWRSIFYYHRVYVKQEANIIIIGAGESARTIAKEIKERPMLKINLAGFVDNDENPEKFEFEGIKIIGKTSELNSIIKKNNIKTVIVAIDYQLDYQTRMDISECIPQGVDVWRMSAYYEKITQKIPVLEIAPEWFMYNFTSVERPLYDFLKRIFDIISALIILTVTFPILVLIGLAVRYYDNGPAIYTQNRVGKGGKLFKLYKLRTMCEGAEKEGMVDKGNTTDNRVIPFCKWVRKARFDEIPQMINILKGDMSIVGPRAEFVEFVEKYEKEIPFYNRRHWIKPGWTGWAQINQGHCVDVDAIIEKLRYDFYYIKHRNIFWDFTILLKAVIMAVTGRHG